MKTIPICRLIFAALVITNCITLLLLFSRTPSLPSVAPAANPPPKRSPALAESSRVVSVVEGPTHRPRFATSPIEQAALNERAAEIDEINRLIMRVGPTRGSADQAELNMRVKRARLYQLYGMAMRELALPPQTLANLKDLLANRMTVPSDIQSVADASGTKISPEDFQRIARTNTESIDANIKDLLTPEQYESYKGWNDRLAIYNKARDYCDRIAFEADPLSNSQMDAVVEACKHIAPGKYQDTLSDVLKNVLNPEQLRVALEYAGEEDRMTALALKIKSQQGK